MTQTFTIPTLPAERPLTERWAHLADFFRRASSGVAGPAPRRTDAITGLLTRSVFLEEASQLLEIAWRERREVSVTSVFVEGIDTDAQRYSEPDANVLLRGAASAINGLNAAPTVLGRVGLAEIVRVQLAGSRSSAWRNHVAVSDAVHDALSRSGVDPCARASLGKALSRGRSIGIDDLIAEARSDRRRHDGAPISAGS